MQQQAAIGHYVQTHYGPTCARMARQCTYTTQMQETPLHMQVFYSIKHMPLALPVVALPQISHAMRIVPCPWQVSMPLILAM